MTWSGSPQSPHDKIRSGLTISQARLSGFQVAVQVAHDEDAHQNNNSDKATMAPDLELSLRSFWEVDDQGVLLTESRNQGRFGRVAASPRPEIGGNSRARSEEESPDGADSDSGIRPSLAESQSVPHRRLL